MLLFGLSECNPASLGNAIVDRIKAHGLLGHVFKMHQPQKLRSGSEAGDYASDRPCIGELFQEFDFVSS